MTREARSPKGDADDARPWDGAINGLNAIERLMHQVEKLGMVLSALSIGIMTLSICLEVIARAGFGTSTLIASELSGNLLAASVLLGMAWTLRDGGFIRVDLVYAMLKGRTLHVANLVIALIGTAVTIILTYYLFIFTLQSFESGATSINVTRTPLWIPQLVMPVGAALLCWGMIAQALRAGALVLYPHLAKPDEMNAAGSEIEGWL